MLKEPVNVAIVRVPRSDLLNLLLGRYANFIEGGVLSVVYSHTHQTFDVSFSSRWNPESVEGEQLPIIHPTKISEENYIKNLMYELPPEKRVEILNVFCVFCGESGKCNCYEKV